MRHYSMSILTFSARAIRIGHIQPGSHFVHAVSIGQPSPLEILKMSNDLHEFVKAVIRATNILWGDLFGM